MMAKVPSSATHIIMSEFGGQHLLYPSLSRVSHCWLGNVGYWSGTAHLTLQEYLRGASTYSEAPHGTIAQPLVRFF